MQLILDRAEKLGYNLIDKGNLTNFLLSGAAITPILSIPGQVLGLALGKTVWCRITNGTVFTGDTLWTKGIYKPLQW